MIGYSRCLSVNVHGLPVLCPFFRKTESAILDVQSHRQALYELCGALAHSHHPAIVIFTDATSKVGDLGFIICGREGNCSGCSVWVSIIDGG